jgi:hypothetical protein
MPSRRQTLCALLDICVDLDRHWAIGSSHGILHLVFNGITLPYQRGQIQKHDLDQNMLTDGITLLSTTASTGPKSLPHRQTESG